MTDATSSPVSGVPRNTRQRYEVLTLLDDESGFRTAYQLHMLLVARGARAPQDQRRAGSPADPLPGDPDGDPAPADLGPQPPSTGSV
jgi:hypothetical protein